MVPVFPKNNKNIFSINSPYHQKDMLLISKANHSVDNLVYLATNENSLKDKYHLENMQILAIKSIENISKNAIHIA